MNIFKDSIGDSYPSYCNIIDFIFTIGKRV